MSACIVWFRQDLRLNDNPALYHAAQAGKIIPLYILDTETDEHTSFGLAKKWWLYHSLQALNSELSKHNTKLVIRKGRPKDILNELIEQTGANKVFWNRLYEPYHVKRDTKIDSYLNSKGVQVYSYNGSLLFEPWEIKNKQGSYYKVFTPFWRACSSKLSLFDLLPIPKISAYNGKKLCCESIDALDLLPNSEKSKGFEKRWSPGRSGATKRLDRFIDNSLEHYKKGRDYPACRYTSELSPHISLGEISVREIYNAVNSDYNADFISSREVFCSELGWRDFSYYLLYHCPLMPDEPLKGRFADFPWDNNPRSFKRWQRGETGYPIVDAGMRELYHTGFMHNRLRMIVGSFLVKHLLIEWQKGLKWFEDNLVDADVANNSNGWQWVAGCGADASPYFRIFNPISQAKRFDKEGDYVRKWVPELAKLPSRYLYAPWEADQSELKKYGISDSYPEPIVEHKAARDKALQAYKKIRKR